MSAAEWTIGVVIPANDEEKGIEATLSSVLVAAAGLRRFWVVVAADACRDETESIARRCLGCCGEVVRLEARTVGRARRRGVSAFFHRFDTTPPARRWVLSTDADTFVPPTWIEDHLRYADRGAAAVAGGVEVDSWAGHSFATRRAFEATYAPSTAGLRAQIHGANLGVRGDAYLDAGGFPAVARSEDRALFLRIRDRGWPVVTTPRLRVRTSGRRFGRVPDGFGAWLRRGCEVTDE